MFQRKTIIKLPSWLLNVAVIFFIIILLSISAYSIFEKKYSNKIYPGIWVGQTDLSGKTKEQSKNILNNKINTINNSGTIFYYKHQQIAILPAVISTESDFSYQIIDFNVEKTIDEIYNFGRNNNFKSNLRDKFNALIHKRDANLIITINKNEIKKILIENFSQFNVPAENAKLINGNENNLKIKEEKLGKILHYEEAIDQLGHNLTQLNNIPIQLFTETDYPQIYKKDCLNIDAKTIQLLKLAPLTLEYDQDQWIINKELLSKWLELKINPQFNANSKSQDKIIVGLNENIVEQFLQNTIASTTDSKPINAKFEIKDGRVVEFQDSKDGFELNINGSFNNIEYELLKNNQNKISLIKTELKSAVVTSNINNFGISKIIGTGESNFSGSPKNRRHNIKNGAEALNGLLIKPDEEFSLNSALGKINAETGYLPELVIKGNRTIAEYGGGLCQIGTTLFRTALSTGLPITQRRSHSYRVSYYEPAGTDATIYSPWPDMRFINDTNNHILIQTRIEGNNLYFDFWGTDDGRVVEKTEPTIYNITKPGPTKYIETLDLELGKKKCTESAHNGADAYFNYKVTYLNGEIKEKQFNSHYVPWQAVCLIGVEKLSTDIASSTDEKIIEE